MSFLDDAWKDLKNGAEDSWKGLKNSVEDLGSWIDKTINDIIPGGWTTLGEAAISFTPLGVAGAAGLGALSGATHGFKKKGFDLTGAIMGGISGYGVGSLASGFTSAGAPGPEMPSGETGWDKAGYTKDADLASRSGMSADEFANQAAQNEPVIDPNATTAPPNPADVEGGVPPAETNFPSGNEVPQTPASNDYTNPNSEMNRAADGSGGSRYMDKVSQAGQGVKNIVGLGPQGLGGVIPAAQAVGAGMGYTAYAGLAMVGLQDKLDKLNQEQQAGNVSNEEYERQKAEIQKAINDAQTAVGQYRYEDDSQTASPQETLYNNQGANQGNRRQSTLYADGGTVDGYNTPDTMMAGGITNSLNFGQGGQMPAYGLGGIIKDEFVDPAISAVTDWLNRDEQAKAQAQAQAQAAAKPMKDYKYEPVPSTEPSSQNNYMGPLLYAQKKSGLGGYGGADHYAQGGQARFLSGGGDGMSDSIKATIDGHQEARLADGEFVIPADVVSHLGNGSSKAGANQLHAMMDRIRKARTGNPKQGKQINPMKFMPA